MVADIGGSDKTIWISQTVTIVNLAGGIPISQVADYWGRKWPLIITCSFALVGTIILSRAQTIGMALGGNFLAAIATIGQPLLNTISAEVLPRSLRAVAAAVITAFYGISGVITLLAGSALTAHNPGGWRVIWYLETGLLATAIVVTFFLYHPLPRPEQMSLTLGEKLAKIDWVGNTLMVLALHYSPWD